jgi:hypothetical protein
MGDKIMVVRHGEKPGSPPPPNGVDSHGVVNPDCLIPRGWQRSGALACLFSDMGVAARKHIAVPTKVYATDPGTKSERPKETVEAVSELQLNGAKPDLTWGEGQETTLVEHAKADAAKGPVLIGWHHQKIPAIANAIVGNDTTTPQHWPGKRFDMVWVFELQSDGKTWDFHQVPQLVLYGDSDKDIPMTTTLADEQEGE